MAAAFAVIGNEHGRFTRIEQVTRAAGVARATFYTYFSSVEDLFVALSEELTGSFNHAVHAHCARGIAPADEAAVAVRSYIRRARVLPAWGWSMVNVSLYGPIFGARTHLAAQATIRHGLEQRAFTCPSESVGLDVLLGTTLASMTTLLLEPVQEDFPEQTAFHVLVALGVPPAQARGIAAMPLPDFAVPLGLKGADPARSTAQEPNV